MQDSHTIYQQIIHSLNVGISFFGADYTSIGNVDFHLREQLYPENAYTAFIQVFHKQASSHSILKIRDDFNVCYYFYNAPQFSVDGRMYFCIGPVLREEISETTLTEIIKSHGLPENLRPELYAYYNRIPVMENLAVFEKTLLSITSGVFERKLSLVTLTENVLKVNTYGQDTFISSLNMANTIETTYRLENQIMDAVAAGDDLSAKKYYKLQNSLTFRPRPGNPLRNMKNRLIVFNVLLRKAIEKGGVHPIYIDDISTRFSIAIENCVALSELQSLHEQMMDDYCRLVRSSATQNYHPLIQKCILYIEQNYSRKLSLKLLADVHFVSRQYLSALFKKETGMNLTNYILEIQMRHAKELLENPTLTITQVAGMCGHDNVDYFTQVFKKNQGMTPGEYRKKCRQSGADGETCRLHFR